MIDSYILVKTLHVLSATVLFGTGLGTAFFFFMANRSNDQAVIADVARNVVRADFFFTTPAIIIQPVSGVFLIWKGNLDPWNDWLLIVYALYLLAGACWLPVVWLQIKMRNMANTSMGALPPLYHIYFRAWFWLGWPAFIAVAIIFYLMIAKDLPW